MSRQLLKEYLRLALQEAGRESLSEAWWEEQYQDASAKNLMLDEPGLTVEPQVRKAIAQYLKQMGLMTGPMPKKFKGKKARKA